jgi:hypothetical protein
MGSSTMQTPQDPILLLHLAPLSSWRLSKPLTGAVLWCAGRLLHTAYDVFSPHATNEYMAVGGVFTVDLLALPPQPKKVSGWTLRQVCSSAHPTPLADSLPTVELPVALASGAP